VLSTDKALADNRSANYWPIPINTKKLILLSYLSYLGLFRLRLLSEDFYLLKGLQSADKTKMHPKQSYKTHPLLLSMEASLMFVYFW